MNSRSSDSRAIEETYIRTACIMLYLILHVLNGTQPDLSLITIDEPFLASVSKKHAMSVLTEYTLKKLSMDVCTELKAASAQAVRRCVLRDRERNEIINELHDLRVPFIQLKGSVLQYLYPVYGSREMVDIDILIDDARSEDVSKMMTEHDYLCKSFQESNHDIYVKRNTAVVEIHRMLFNPEKYPDYAGYYQDVFQRVNLIDDFEYRFSPEDFYVYMLLHMKLHYDTAGIGLKALLDVFLFRKRYNAVLDEEYIRGQLEALNAFEFEREIVQLVGDIQNKNPNELAQIERLRYFIVSGSNGTRRIYRRKQLHHYHAYGSMKGKLRYIRDRVIGDERKVNSDYPFMSRYRPLRMITPVFRLIKKIKTSPQDLSKEISELSKTKQ